MNSFLRSPSPRYTTDHSSNVMRADDVEKFFRDARAYEKEVSIQKMLKSVAAGASADSSSHMVVTGAARPVSEDVREFLAAFGEPVPGGGEGEVGVSLMSWLRACRAGRLPEVRHMGRVAMLGVFRLREECREHQGLLEESYDSVPDAFFSDEERWMKDGVASIRPGTSPDEIFRFPAKNHAFASCVRSAFTPYK